MVLAEADTKGKILDAAEELFSKRGFLNTSLRVITQEAGVNLAAVNYHFGGKDALIFAVIDRFVTPLNEERLRLLEEAEAAAGPDGLSVEAVAHAFLDPTIQFWSERDIWPRRMKLMARAMIELGPKSVELRKHLFEKILRRFLPALAATAPHLGENELVWRFYFTVGAMGFVFHSRERSGDVEGVFIPELSEEHAPELLLQHMVATFKAPATLPVGADRDRAEPSSGATVKGVGR